MNLNRLRPNQQGNPIDSIGLIPHKLRNQRSLNLLKISKKRKRRIGLLLSTMKVQKKEEICLKYLQLPI